jgi:hypothetical protein
MIMASFQEIDAVEMQQIEGGGAVEVVNGAAGAVATGALVLLEAVSAVLWAGAAKCHCIA